MMILCTIMPHFLTVSIADATPARVLCLVRVAGPARASLRPITGTGRSITFLSSSLR
jgi:hypothetical protein